MAVGSNVSRNFSCTGVRSKKRNIHVKYGNYIQCDVHTLDNDEIIHK